MNKYLNIIIISFFAVITSGYKIGFSLFIPIVCFLTFNNNKNMLLIIPVSFLSIYVFGNKDILHLGLIMGLIIIYQLLINNDNEIFNSIFVFTLTVASLLYKDYSKEILIINIIFALTSTVLYGYFKYNLDGAKINEGKVRNYTYNEVIMAVVAVFGSTLINVGNLNISIFVAMYFSMYFSKNDYPFHSVFYSLICMFFLRFVFDIEESILIPFVSAFYMFPSIYAPIALICFCLLGILTNIELFMKDTLKVVIGLSIFFEIIKRTIISKHSSESIVKGVYNQAIENVNNEVLAFASFLDLFSKEFSTSKDYSQKLSEGINSLTHYYCEGCYVRRECFTKNKGKLYTFFKNLILYSKRSDSDFKDAEAISFFKSCPYIVEMRKSSILINEKLNISKSNIKNNYLIAQINGFTNVIRQFCVDNTLKNELDYELFDKLHKGLNDYGFNICLFETKKTNSEDYLIELGIKGESFKNIKDTVEEICNHYLPNNTTCIFNSSSKGRTYMTIVPNIRYEVEYGYGSIAQEGNSVCGDNYLIKNLNNSKLIAAISDGMGKGYAANQESYTTLRLVDEITKTSLTTDTALQILNTFYFIQDYLEKYSTLDFLEVDRAKGTVVFYKMGAASSYIFHKDGSFKKIINEGLPFGIEEIIDAKQYEISKDDLIVMASDGIFENIVNEKELENFIKGIIHLSPQKITYEILNYARSHKAKTLDDMSVITLKILTA